jgi:hypothetical protein
MSSIGHDHINFHSFSFLEYPSQLSTYVFASFKNYAIVKDSLAMHRFECSQLVIDPCRHFIAIATMELNYMDVDTYLHGAWP